MVLDAIIGKKEDLVILVHEELDGICGCGVGGWLALVRQAKNGGWGWGMTISHACDLCSRTTHVCTDHRRTHRRAKQGYAYLQ